MAGIAFWGGFASGMSQSIEKNRDRLQKQKKLDADAARADADALAKQRENQFKLSQDTREAFNKVNEKIAELKSADYEGTEEERVPLLNQYNKEKMDILKSASDYGANLGMKPQDIIATEGEEITQNKTIDVEGEKYIIPTDLEVAINESQGKMKLVGNRVHQQVMTANSQGVPVPQLDDKGNPVFEDAGVELQKYDNVFETAKPKGGGSGFEAQAYAQHVADSEAKGEQPMSRMEFHGQYKQAEVPSENADIAQVWTNAPDVLAGKEKYDRRRAADNTAKMMQFDKTYTKDEREKFEASKKVVSASERAIEQIEQGIKSGAFEGDNQYQNLLNDLKVQYLPDKWNTMSKSEKNKAYARMATYGTMGKIMSSYLRSISGTAASEGEAFRTMRDMMLGGSLSNIDSRLHVLKNFTENTKGDAKDYATQMWNKGDQIESGKFLFEKPPKEFDARLKEAMKRRKDWTEEQAIDWMNSKGWYRG